MNLTCLPRMPPPALISVAARPSESRTVCSLMAIAPDVEFRNPSLTVSPLTQVSEDAAAFELSAPALCDDELPLLPLLPLLPHAAASKLIATKPPTAAFLVSRALIVSLVRWG